MPRGRGYLLATVTPEWSDAGVDVFVRRARPAEAAIIGELTEQAYRVDGYLDVAGGDAYAAELRDAAPRIREAVVLVAELDGTVAAAVALAAPGTPYAELATAGELEVRMLAVAPQARRRGLAEVLMVAAEEHARTLGLQRVVLCTEAPMHAPQRLYKRLGYRREPERDWQVQGFRLLGYGRSIGTEPADVGV